MTASAAKKSGFTTPEGNAGNIAAFVVPRPYPEMPEATFALVRDKEYEKFAYFAYATTRGQSEYEVSAAFIGRVDRRKNFKAGKYGGNGFGHMGCCEFQVMLRSVSEVKVGEAKGSLIPTRSALPDRLPENH